MNHQIEALEARRLLATLTIEGSNDATKPDNITVKLLSNGNTQVVNGGAAAIKVNGSSVNPGGTNSKPNIDKVDVKLLAGNDKFTTDGNVNAKITVAGGSGNDSITGSKSADVLRGEDGNDTLSGASGTDSLDGGNGNDTLIGGEGNDTLIGGADADDFRGGGGIDVADFTTRSDNLVITLEDVANDGGGARTDNVRSDVEIVLGGAGNDSITGNNAANSLNGGAGNDTLVGLGGSDVLGELLGVLAFDYPELGDDRIFGGSGNDTLTGGSGIDLLDGQDGNDTIFANDGAKDTVLGGSGTDSVKRDTVDALTSIEVVLP